MKLVFSSVFEADFAELVAKIKGEDLVLLRLRYGGMDLPALLNR